MHEGSTLRFVHAADLHVDSPLKGLDRYEGAPAERLRGATRRALENLVALCIETQAAFLLLAGDVFDGSWKDYSTGLFFSAQMARLREAKIPVVLVRGNHDAASSVTKALRLPDNVRELGHKKPESIEIVSGAVIVHGQSFGQRATTDDLAVKYPDRRHGYLNIGILHTCLDGREGHEPYAPTSIETLTSKGYDYWALGHVHAREVLSKEPWIVFPGNLQGRNIKETGAKGATLVTITDGRITEVEHRSLDVVRWAMVEVDASAANDEAELLDLVRTSIEASARDADGRLLAVRLVLRGATRVNSVIRRDEERFVNELRASATDALGDGVWLEKIKIETRSTFDVAALKDDASAVGHLARRLAQIKQDDKELAALAAELAELDKKLPPELREGDGALKLGEAATVRAFMEDVEQTLLSALLEGER